MAVYKAEFFALKPGLVLLALGLVLTLPLTFGPITIGPITFSLYWMLLGMMLSLVGLTSFFFGCFAQMFSDYTGLARLRWMRVFRYTGAVLTSLAVFTVGLGLCVALAVNYVSNNFTLPPARSAIDHAGMTGVLFVMMGFSTFCFTLAVNATGVRYGATSPIHATDLGSGAVETDPR
jgi:hypothetical protein